MATNNSINSNIPIEIAKGGTNATSMATSDGVVYYDGTRLVTTAAGTSGQVLTSNGAGVAPTYQASSGKFVLIQSQTASASATINFTTGISATYSTYFFLVSNVTPGTNGSVLWLLVSTDGGSTWITTGTEYVAGSTYNAFNANTWTNTNVNPGANFILSAALTTPPAYSAAFYFYNVTNGNNISYNGFSSFTVNAGAFSWGSIAGYLNTTTNVNGFQFKMSAGTIASGTFSLYGVKES